MTMEVSVSRRVCFGLSWSACMYGKWSPVAVAGIFYILVHVACKVVKVDSDLSVLYLVLTLHTTDGSTRVAIHICRVKQGEITASVIQEDVRHQIAPTRRTTKVHCRIVFQPHTIEQSLKGAHPCTCPCYTSGIEWSIEFFMIPDDILQEKNRWPLSMMSGLSSTVTHSNPSSCFCSQGFLEVRFVQSIQTSRKLVTLKK